ISQGIQGVGGGGIIQLILITIGDIVTFEERPKYTGMLGAVFGVASVVGPLVGGVFSDCVSWRWAFWIVGQSCNLGYLPCSSKTLRQYVDEFDFLGLFLIMAGVICLLVGFQSGQTSWFSP
ncbi:hypothetical protein K435DRAFT_671442, partial [Dendrothele bispora CBS 962.96]